MVFLAVFQKSKERKIREGSIEPLKWFYRTPKGSIEPLFGTQKVLSHPCERDFRTTDRVLSNLSHRTPPFEVTLLKFSQFSNFQAFPWSLDGRKRAFFKTDTRVSKRAFFSNTSMSKWFLDLFEAMVDSVSVRFQNASVSKKYVFKQLSSVECGDRLRVGVRAKNASVSGFACRPF